MAEGIRKSDGIIDLQQQVRDPDSWQPLVQIKNKLISLRRDGGTYDNALAETINGLYKTEVIRRRSSWKTMEEVELEMLKWVDWFNNRRLLEPIGNIPPAEAEDAFYANLNILDMVA